MIFKYQEILRSKYRDINLSRWYAIVSHNQKVNVEASLEQRAEEKESIAEENVRRRKNLSNENQQYLEKRLRTDFSV